MNSATVSQLLDYKRQVAELYARVRSTREPQAAWEDWRETRSRLFAQHPQSAFPEDERETRKLDYFAYDPAFRVLASVEEAASAEYDVGSSDGGSVRFVRTGRAHFTLGENEHSLDLLWLDAYGGGLFVPIKDLTAGKGTYGGGRYVLDTVKGADLGMEGERLVLDFNFAYNPSCSYDPRWSCPLAPPGNRLELEIRAGEKHKE
jgi:uncharacterized protein (DUF1684 family)